jgi:phospholipase/carboxylesterase
MHEGAVVVARTQPASQLALLIHGVGASAASLVPLGEAIAERHRDAMVVSVDGPHRSTLGSGREWFFVVGITEQDRPGGIALALRPWRDAVTRWQDAAGVGPSRDGASVPN